MSEGINKKWKPKAEYFYPESETSRSIKPQKVTGHFMAQFNDEDPIKIIEVMDFGSVTLKLNQKGGNAEISFTSENGKTFKLFIKPI